MTDLQSDTDANVLRRFRVEIENTPNPASRRSFIQAVDSYRKFMDGQDVPFDDFNETNLREWIVWLFLRGYTYKTVCYYVNRLSSLSRKSLANETVDYSSTFSKIKSGLETLSSVDTTINCGTDCFRKICRVPHLDCSTNAVRQLAKDIVLFSLYNGGLPFEKIASFKKTDYTGADVNVCEIVERYARPKNKYLFPLNQSDRTPNQLNRAISLLFTDILSAAGIQDINCDSSITAQLWAVAAMSSGIAVADIVSCVQEIGTTNRLLSFVSGDKLDICRITEIRKRISRMMAKNPVGWYAMQFRPHVNIDMVMSRLKNIDINITDTFYPMEEIYKRIGKKKVRRTKPIVPGLLFFRCRATDLTELFYNIGDLAWGYRQTGNARSPYACIDNASIDIYRKTIGQFSDGLEIHPEGTIQMQPGDRVEIIGGELIGYKATFEKEIKHQSAPDDREGGRIIYRLRLMGHNCIEWVVNVDPRLVSKL